jgi:hypothetical protein
LGRASWLAQRRVDRGLVLGLLRHQVAGRGHSPEVDVEALTAMLALKHAADDDKVRRLYSAMVGHLTAEPRH